MQSTKVLAFGIYGAVPARILHGKKTKNEKGYSNGN